MKNSMLVSALALGALVAACGGNKEGGAGASTAAAPAAAAPAGQATPDAGGKVDSVQMIADEKGSRYEPAEITAKKGDVVRYVLKIGVHNVHFLADSNPGIQGLPAAASDLLQLPGQTYDFKVTQNPGQKIYFQCDPHVALGMKGHITVQ